MATASTPRLSTADVVEQLLDIRNDALELERYCASDLVGMADHDRSSAVNLLHYIALRAHDVRGLQRELAFRGLSSLGRSEGHVLATLDAVLGHLGVGADDLPSHDSPAPPGPDEGRALLERHSREALGRPAATGGVRLMVTLPGEAATDPGIVDELADAGMDLARINCAHDDATAWTAMASHVRAAARRVGREIRVAFDLGGPKLRTGALPDGPEVIRIRPRRGADGVVQRRARVRFVALDGDSGAVDDSGTAGDPADPDLTVVPVEASLVQDAAEADELSLRDTRGRRRRFDVVAAGPGFLDATSDRTGYLASTMRIKRRRDGDVIATGAIGALAPTESFIRVHAGDRVRVAAGVEHGRLAVHDVDGTVTDPITIGCDLPEVFESVRVGDRILIDDGRIAGVIDRADAGGLEFEVQRPERGKIKAGKGINLPDTALRTAALTDDDRAALEVIAPIADLISLSFVQSVDDVETLRAELDRLGRPDVAIGLKIEQTAAFEALPKLLLYACRRPPVAVMIARGDLAIEVGFERLAELQEQILWLCEAAHVPVIWATQVVESLAKSGIPTRAEVTDAVGAGRAECVMLNKGPHITDAIRFLDDVFDRMGNHQDKQTQLLRRLSVTEAFGRRGSDQ